MKKKKSGYVCSVGWDYEMEGDEVKVYPSAKKLRGTKCVQAQQCGIYKIEMRLVKVLRKCRFFKPKTGVIQKKLKKEAKP